MTGGDNPASPGIGDAGRWKLDLLIREFARLINSEVALLCQVRNKLQPPTIIASWGLQASRKEIRRLEETGLVGPALPLRRPALEPLHPLLDSSLVHATHPPLGYAATAPVRLPTAIAGRLIAGFVTPPQDRTLALWTAESYAALIALYLADQRLLDELVAHRDGLRGCLTYDEMRHELDREINRSARHGLQLSVCVIHLDGLQRIDDELGHVSHNPMLELVASILRTSVRSGDTVGRYGRDELIAILPQTRRDKARRLAERLGSELANTPTISPERPLTASLGIAQWTPGTSSEELLAAAESALLATNALRARHQPARRAPTCGVARPVDIHSSHTQTTHWSNS
jgi:diguanylate cyclase (GGDEF)-like protein